MPRALSICLLLAAAAATASDAAAQAMPDPSAERSQTFFAAAATSDKGPLAGHLGWGARFGRWGLGLEVAAGLARDMAIEGIVVDDGSRLRARLPLLVRFGGEGSLAADLVVGPGLRYIEGEGLDALAVTTDTAFIGHARLSEGVSLHTGLMLPLAIDVTGAGELALFPGAGWMLGAEVGLGRSWSLLAQGFLAAPEGYGGDGAKSVVEGALSLRWHLGGRGLSNWIHLPTSL